MAEDPKEVSATDVDAEMAAAIAIINDPSVVLVESIVDHNAEHGSNPELEDPDEVAKL